MAGKKRHILVPVLVAILAAGGCARTNMAVPFAERAVVSESFPSFRAEPVAAARQIPEGSEAGRINSLERSGDRATSTPIPTSDVERLRRIRALHERRTIARIEG